MPVLLRSPNAYNNELRVCIDAYVRGYGGDWPSGLPPLSEVELAVTIRKCRVN
jgi:hypothetical protein